MITRGHDSKISDNILQLPDYFVHGISDSIRKVQLGLNMTICPTFLADYFVANSK